MLKINDEITNVGITSRLKLFLFFWKEISRFIVKQATIYYKIFVKVIIFFNTFFSFLYCSFFSYEPTLAYIWNQA